MNFAIRSIAFAAVALATTTVGAQEVTLKAVSFVPKNNPYSVDFQKHFVDIVNQQGKGQVQIDFVGGQEVVPGAEQGRAVRGGQIDILYGVGGLYLNLVPEGDAFLSTNLSPTERRANGAIDLANTIWDKKLNSRILGQGHTGFGFHLYFKDAPKMGPDGVPDLKGLKMRVSPAWREFVAGLGGTTVVLPSPDVYTALERGTVDGTGWSIAGVDDLGWNKFLKYRIDPQFMRTDILVVVNNDKYKAISPAARKLLDDTGLAFEKTIFELEQKSTQEADAKQRAGGMNIVTLQGPARSKYLSAAYESGWSRVKERAPENYEALRAKFYKPE